MALIPEEVRREILSKLPGEPSDTVLSKEFGVSRKTIYRLRKLLPKREKIRPPPPPKVEDVPPIGTPPVPAIPESKEEPPPESAVKPKVTMSSVQLGTYFAIQLLQGENYMDVAYAVTAAADSAGILFRKLQVLDLPTFGTTNFVRFRSDIEDIRAVIKSLGRESYIIQESSAFIARLPNGRKGKYSTSAMLAAPRMGLGQVFFGTRVKRWEHQFKKEISPIKAG
jgi:hypothetical protein